MTTRLMTAMISMMACGALALGCGAQDDGTGDEADLVQGQCAVTNAQTGKAMSATARKNQDDPFFTTVLNAKGDKCANSVDAVLAKLKANAGQSDQVFAVFWIGMVMRVRSPGRLSP